MTVVNYRQRPWPAGAVLVDRSTKWGNPFPMRNPSDAERARVIAEHEKWLHAKLCTGEIKLEDLAALHGKPLVCWCAPKPCHADTLKRLSAWAVEELARK